MRDVCGKVWKRKLGSEERRVGLLLTFWSERDEENASFRDKSKDSNINNSYRQECEQESEEMQGFNSILLFMELFHNTT